MTRLFQVHLAWLLIVGGCDAAVCGEGLTQLGDRCIDPDAAGDCGGPCGEHEFCDPMTLPNTCKCAPGYAGDPCAWSGVVQNSGFSQDLYWSDEGGKGAVVRFLAPGSQDVGEGALDASVICNAGGLSQVLEMPSYDLAEPLVAEVTYQAQDVYGFAVGFDRAWKRLPPTGESWKTETFCLGEAAYGKVAPGVPVTLTLSASERLATCFDADPAGEIRIDRFVVRPASAGQCVRPGEVLNGAAVVSEGGWRFTSEGAASAALLPEVGREQTSGARLFRASGDSGRAAMTTQISVPLPSSLPSPALRFWWRGSAEALFEAEIGTWVDLDDRGRKLATLVGANSAQNNLYCLPGWTHGSVLDLSFSLGEGSGIDSDELLVDDVAIVSDPSCGGDATLVDPGFESAPNDWMGFSLGSAEEDVVMQQDGAVAQTGEGALELTYWNSAADLAMERYLLVPESKDAQGPAVTFYSKSPSPPSTAVRWVLGRDEVISDAVKTSSTWERNEVCLPAAWVDRWFRVQVQVGPPEGIGLPIGQESVFLDDFALTTTASCPSEP